MNAALLLTALFNGAWQGALLCVIAVFAFRFFRRLNATTMFTVWSVLLVIAVALPFANYAFATKPYVVVHTVVAAPPQGTAHTPIVLLRPQSTAQVSKPLARPAIAPQPITFQNAAKAVFQYAPEILLVLAGIALLRLAVLGRDVVRMLVARSRVRPIDAPVTLSGSIARPFRFAASHEFTSPCVLGFAPARIVIPEDLLEQPGTELTSVVLHEREHVRRFDDIQNVAQRFIGAIAFFCPGVRIALRELALYREQICDDAAVNVIGDRVSYAMTLTDLAQWAQGRGTPVPSLIFKRKHLLHRLEVLLDSAVSHSLRMNRRFALVAVTTLAIAAALFLRIQVPVIAETVKTIPAHYTVTIAQRPHQARRAIRHEHARTNAPERVHTHVHARRHANAARAKRSERPAWHDPSSLALTRHQTSALIRTQSVAQVVAFSAATRRPDAVVSAVSAPVLIARNGGSDDLLDALSSAGMNNLPVDKLIALRDHGVSADLIRSATSYFGHVSADDLVYLADHGVGSSYIATLRSGGITGISPHDAVNMMDRGVGSTLIRSAISYFAVRPGPNDLIAMADHGVGSSYIEALRAAHVSVSWQETIQMMDSGVDAAYVAKIRRMNPHATIADIIRLRNAGF